MSCILPVFLHSIYQDHQYKSFFLLFVFIQHSCSLHTRLHDSQCTEILTLSDSEFIINLILKSNVRKGVCFLMEYTKVFDYRCPTDASKVKHTVTFTKGSCSRYPEDIMTSFVCSRNSACSKCAENYRD